MKNITKRVTSVLVVAAAVLCASTAALGESSIGILSDLGTSVSAAEGVSYINAAGEAKLATKYTAIKSSTTKLNGGWYVVSGKTVIDGRLKVMGDSYVILTDGAKLTVTGGISVNNGVKFNVYTQQDGTGSLYAGTTNGRSTTADDGVCGIGGSGARVYIVGGNVYAIGGSGSYGIQGADIRLYWTNPGDSVYASSYSTSVSVMSAFADRDNGAAYYSSSVSASALKGITLKAARVVDKDTLVMDNGVFAVFDNIKLADRVNVSGDSELYLANGGTLTVEEGIGVVQDASLSIYGNGGKLYAGTRNGSTSLADSGFAGIGADKGTLGGDIYINSGIVYANGGTNAAGIGGSKAYVEIKGGTVYATGGDRGAAIGSGYNDKGATVSITGGNVTANAGLNGAGIGSGNNSSRSSIDLGYSTSNDKIYATSYNGTVRFLKTMYTSDGRIADTGNINGKTLSGNVSAYTVTFDTNGGTYAAPKSVQAGKTIGTLPAVTRNGYIFDGWYIDRNFYNRFNVNSAITDNITLYAKWNRGYTVTFYSNGAGYIAPKTVTAGRTIDVMPYVERSGYTFDGWYTDQYFNYKFNVNTAINSDITLYAKWSSGYVTVTFDAVKGWFPNGNSTVRESVKSGNNITNLIPADPTYTTGYTDYVFIGWYYDKSGKKPYTGQTFTKDTTLYALYVEDSSYCTITFDANGGKFSDGSKTTTRQLDKGSSALTVAPYDPTYTNGNMHFNFIGWCYDAAGNRDYNGERLYENITLYASYQYVESVYTISFNTNGGNSVSPITTTEGDRLSVTDLPFPTRRGFIFEGWYTNASLTSKVYDYYTVTGNATLYAGWEEEAPTSYTISFNSNGGSYCSSMTVAAGDTVSSNDLPFPNRSGYKFSGWYADSYLSTKVTRYTVNGDVTFYADWEEEAPATHTVRFFLDGTLVDTQYITDGDYARNNYAAYDWKTGSNRDYNFNEPVYTDLDLNATTPVATPHTVRFYIDNVLSDTQTVADNDYAVNRYPYMTWTTAYGSPFSFNSPITEDVDLYAYTYDNSVGSTFGGAGLIAAIAGGVAVVGGGIAAGVVISKKKKNGQKDDKDDK